MNGEVLLQNSLLSPTIPSDRDTKLNDFNTRSNDSSGLNRAATGQDKAMEFDDLVLSGRGQSHLGDQSQRQELLTKTETVTDDEAPVQHVATKITSINAEKRVQNKSDRIRMSLFQTIEKKLIDDPNSLFRKQTVVYDKLLKEQEVSSETSRSN